MAVSSLPLIVGLFGFVAAALAYAGLALLVLAVHPGSRQADWLVGALLMSALWAGASLAVVWSQGAFAAWLPRFDAVHTAAWVLFLGVMLIGSAEAKLATRLGRGAIAAAIVLTGTAVLAAGPGESAQAVTAGAYAVLLPMLALQILGLLTLEQIFRNSSFRQHAFLRPLSLGIGLIFVTDLFIYSQAALFAEINQNLWLYRGVANAAAAPLILVAVNRQPDWGRELFVSRQVVFYTAGLLGAVAYLLAMGIGAVVIAGTDESWGTPAQVVFLLCAGTLLVYALFSSELRNRFRIFIAKHFLRERYDYREEWLRLTEALAGRGQSASLAERSVKALAAIISSPAGELWFARGGTPGFVPCGAWGMPMSHSVLPGDDPLVRFLAVSRWVVDTREYAEDPDKYSNAFVLDGHWTRTPSIIVPLVHENDLVGIVRLDRPSLLGTLGFKDHDLLKTAGQQVAVSLAQERAQEELSETRQFETFSKLTAFLMHDLKNMIAQQELVVGNARHFRHRPEFIDDAIETIAASVRRMKALLERLQTVNAKEQTSRIDLRRLLQEVCEACADRKPKPELQSGVGARVAMDREKLTTIVTHAIRNAQDATAADGRIELRLDARDGMAVIEIADSGVGMDADFVRDHLFKPFYSTKGAQGMGIGAYQIRETLRAAAGDLEVASEPGKGTTLRMKLPLAVPPENASASSAA